MFKLSLGDRLLNWLESWLELIYVIKDYQWSVKLFDRSMECNLLGIMLLFKCRLLEVFCNLKIEQFINW